jgi:putative transposase
LRRIKIRREKGGVFTLITNDLTRSAVEIGALYKQRWAIELLFRWLKQHLKIGKFFGHSPHAIRLQVFAAMIAHALVLIARQSAKSKLPPHRFLECITQYLFERRSVLDIEKPPPINSSKKTNLSNPNQMTFCYA